LSDQVKAATVRTIFRKTESQYGTAYNHQQLADKSVIRWDHFEAKLNRKFVSRDTATIVSEANSTAQVFKRGLDELTITALETVLALIRDNLIYRGTEFNSLVKEFKALKDKYTKLNSDQARAAFVWENVNSFAAKFRNTVIGTLVQDLSDNVDMEAAVRMYESKVAPTNYKRTSALITPMMVKDAMKTIETLGVDRSLDRRFANLADISVNNALFVDNAVKGKMRDGGIADLLMQEVKSTKKNTDRATAISIDDFMTNIVPRASSIDLLVKNSMTGNLASLTAPVHSDAPNLFKWDNGFGWSYNGNITDSIKEKVKRAGGNVDARLRASLNWFNKDDLDIHVIEPNGNRICFHNKCGKLDVDMNISMPVRDAVENVRWLQKPADGVYQVIVNNYNVRESIDVGFNLQVESEGKIYEFSYQHAVRGDVKAVDLTVKGGVVVSVNTHPRIVSTFSSQNVWGLNTEDFVKVSTIVASPNHWDEKAVGNKHWFFILEGCVNPDDTRGFYNEFLRTDLEKHRKVFEILGDKMKCRHTDNQMSGLGFSSTKKDSVIVHVKGQNLNQQYEINF